MYVNGMDWFFFSWGGGISEPSYVDGSQVTHASIISTGICEQHSNCTKGSKLYFDGDTVGDSTIRVISEEIMAKIGCKEFESSKWFGLRLRIFNCVDGSCYCRGSVD